MSHDKFVCLQRLQESDRITYINFLLRQIPMPSKAFKKNNARKKQVYNRQSTVQPNSSVERNKHLENIINQLIPSDLFDLKVSTQQAQRCTIEQLSLKKEIVLNYNFFDRPMELLVFLIFCHRVVNVELSIREQLQKKEKLAQIINKLFMDKFKIEGISTSAINGKIILKVNPELLNHITTEKELTEFARSNHLSALGSLIGFEWLKSKEQEWCQILQPLSRTLKDFIIGSWSFFFSDIFALDESHPQYIFRLLCFIIKEPIDKFLQDNYSPRNGTHPVPFLNRFVQKNDQAVTLQLLNCHISGVLTLIHQNAVQLQHNVKELVLSLAQDNQQRNENIIQDFQQKCKKNIQEFNAKLAALKPAKPLKLIVNEKMFSNLKHVSNQSFAKLAEIQARYYNNFLQNRLANDKLNQMEFLIQAHSTNCALLSQYQEFISGVFKIFQDQISEPKVKLEREGLSYGYFSIEAPEFYSLYELLPPLECQLLQARSDLPSTSKQVPDLPFFSLFSIIKRTEQQEAELLQQLIAIEQGIKVPYSVPQTVVNLINSPDISFFKGALLKNQIVQITNSDKYYFYFPQKIKERYRNDVDYSSLEIKIVRNDKGDYGWKYIGHLANVIINIKNKEYQLPITYELKTKNTSDRILGAMIPVDLPNKNIILIVAIGFVDGGLHTSASTNKAVKKQWKITLP